MTSHDAGPSDGISREQTTGATAVLLTAGAATALSLAAVFSAAGPASASTYGFEINGTYRVISNGDWAKTNEVYRNEDTVVQIWTISSSCVTPEDCSGEVVSDHGWSARLQYAYDRWTVEREIPRWQPCPDGTAATGHQKMNFYGVDRNDGSMTDPTNTDLMAGIDITHGESGACGINKALFIKMPMRLERLA